MFETAHTAEPPEAAGLADGDIVVVPEAVCRDIIGRQEAFTAIEAVFAAMAKKDAWNFPVVREALGHENALYGFKSGFDQAGMALGLKSGGYWPNNTERGLTNHQSTVFLFDPDTGRVKALVAGNYLTAVRTAAASAVSIAHLARRDAEVLGIVGAGHQSSFQLQAALEQRNFDKVVAWNKSPAGLSKLETIAIDAGLVFEAVDQKTLGRQADVIITITSARDALLQANWINPGAHIACMGTDTKGKQEVDPALFPLSAVFTDELAQSISIGEAQHAVADSLIEPGDITSIGDVINGDAPGRTSDDQITVFDGTGVGLQDLAVAASVVDLAIEAGRVDITRLT